MTPFDEVSIATLAERIPDGALLGVPADYSGVPMAATRALIARGVRDLRLFCLPLTTIQGDMLIGAGCVASVETAAVTLGEHGLAPRFTDAVQSGRLTIRDSTCPALHAQLQAAEKGVSFMPLRGIIGSDLLANRPDWTVMDCPFGGGLTVVLPATRLDATLFHAEAADRNGNILIGRRRELATLAHASERVLVTVERILDTDFFEDEKTAATALPAFYVEALAVAERGAWPCGLTDQYAPDGAEIARYAAAAKTEAGFADYLDAALGRSAA